MRRYVAIWFRHLLTDRVLLRSQELSEVAFVLAAKHKGRMIVMATSPIAEKERIQTGMVLADARAILPDIQVLDYQAGQEVKLLSALAEWAIRYSPLVSVDQPDGLLLDASGCAHLRGSESAYLKDIASRLKASGYNVRTAMADTLGAAWTFSRFSRSYPRKHESELAAKEGKTLNLSADNEKITELIGSTKYYLLLNTFRDEKWNEKILKHYQRNIISFLRSRMSIHSDDSIGITCI